jgi:two-component system, chemotaxis family, chemotaxis protein CheY
MKTCLVVDDSGVVRSVARRMLERMAFHVVEADNGETALHRCGEAIPDAIILDWNMPVMDGLGFLQKLRASEGGLGPKVIFCTTMNDLAHIATALALGADEYIMKPFDEEILREKLEEVGVLERQYS